MTTDTTFRSDERGIALVVTLFMVLILSVLGASLVFISRTETISSLNYKTMSQTRYGAESGIHHAANHLLWAYVPPGTAAELALYDLTTTPVRVVANGRPVVLSNNPDVPSNYPDNAQLNAFVAALANPGALNVNNGAVAYNASATLLKMRQIADPFVPGQTLTLQTWQIVGTGTVPGAASAEVEVSAVIERQAVPVFKYAAFATDPGCDALRFGGGATTDSYNSKDFMGVGVPAVDDWGGNVGTNGNMNEIGNTTTVHGSLSTPRTGVGACGGGNGGAVSALTVQGGATVDGGIVELPQAVAFPQPPVPDPLPPIGNQSFNGGCPPGTAAFCANNGGSPIIDPSLTGGTVTLADVRVTGTSLTLKPGVYIVNSLTLAGGSTLTIDVDPASTEQVTFIIAGQANNTPIDLTGGSISNTTYDPSRFQLFYAGDQSVKLTGGAGAAALVYAPNATASFSGGGNFYGAVVAGRVTDMGGASIHYDRNLDKKALAAGNWTMSSFTWSSF